MEREQRFYDDRFVFEDAAVYEELCASSEPVDGCSGSARDKSNVYNLVLERVVVPDVIAAEELVPSVLAPDAFEEEILQAFVDTPERFPRLQRRSSSVRVAILGIDGVFFAVRPSATPEVAGIRTAALGTLWIALITILFAVPVGVGATIYLVEFARPTRFNEFIQTNINNLAGVPSVIYGMLGLAVLVRTFEPVTSGDIFTSGPPPSENGRTVLAAGITLGLLVLPIIIISAQEALKAVPNSLRQAGMGLGATKWQTVRSQVLPVALPGILTGVILSVARAIGETAPLIVVGGGELHHRRPLRAVLQIHGDADPDLPMDQPATGRMAAPGGRRHHRLAGDSPGPQRHGRHPEKPIFEKSMRDDRERISVRPQTEREAERNDF